MMFESLVSQYLAKNSILVNYIKYTHSYIFILLRNFLNLELYFNISKKKTYERTISANAFHRNQIEKSCDRQVMNILNNELHIEI